MLYLVFVLSECIICSGVFFFQAEDGIRDLVRSRGLGDVYKRQYPGRGVWTRCITRRVDPKMNCTMKVFSSKIYAFLLSLIHI
mgnify:CR=1 FL=1